MLKFFLISFFFFVVNLLSGENESELKYILNHALTDSTKANAYFNLGDYYFFSKPAVANSYLDSAVLIIGVPKNRNEKKMLSEIFYYKGAVYSIQGNYSRAVEYYQKSLNISEQLLTTFPNDTPVVLRIINNKINLALIQNEEEHHSEALNSFKKILLNYNNYISEKKRGRIYNNIGVIYHRWKNNDSALVYYYKALNIYKKHKMDRNVSMAYLNLGSIYSNFGYYNKSEEYLLKALEMKNRLNDDHGKAICLLSLAEVEYSKGEYLHSLQYTNRALTISEKKGFLKQNRDAYKLASKNHEKLSEYKQALKNFKMFKSVNDSIFSTESRNKIMELRTQYETREKEAQILLLKQKEKNQRFIKKILIAGMVLILLTSLLIIRIIILKKRNEKRLFAVRKQLDEKEKNLIRSKLEKKELETKELNREIEFKSKQLTTHALNMMQKNKLLQNLTTEIDNISRQAKPEIKTELKKIKRLVKLNIKTDKEWDLFKLYFEQINKGFFEKLIAINTSLNIYDLRHCALIKLNMNIKESASVLNLSPNSVKSARYRLKKKLELLPEDDLYEFIRGL